jgi:hypothetical protein
MSGLCAPCVVERVAEAYTATDHRAVGIRVQSWTTRTTRPDEPVVRLRQARHRLIAAARPETPAPPGTDPLQIGLEQAVELVRQLAWGPQD